VWSGVARCGNGQQISLVTLYPVKNYVACGVNKWLEWLGSIFVADLQVARSNRVSLKT